MIILDIQKRVSKVAKYTVIPKVHGSRMSLPTPSIWNKIQCITLTRVMDSTEFPYE